MLTHWGLGKNTAISNTLQHVWNHMRFLTHPIHTSHTGCPGWVPCGSHNTEMLINYYQDPFWCHKAVNSLSSDSEMWQYSYMCSFLIYCSDFPWNCPLKNSTLLHRWMSTLVQVMAWCHQAQSHYMIQCWPNSMKSNSIIKGQWVNGTMNHCQEAEGFCKNGALLKPIWNANLARSCLSINLAWEAQSLNNLMQSTVVTLQCFALNSKKN